MTTGWSTAMTMTTGNDDNWPVFKMISINAMASALFFAYWTEATCPVLVERVILHHCTPPRVRRRVDARYNEPSWPCVLRLSPAR